MASTLDCGITRRQLIVGGSSVAALMAMSSSLSVAHIATTDGEAPSANSGNLANHACT